MTGQFSDPFRLSITDALSTQLYAALESLEPAPLTEENINSLYSQAEKLGLPTLSGVYQLFRQAPGEERQLTYVGKADQPLPKRLGDHYSKLSGRCGIALEEMSFRCLFVEEDLSAVSPEKMLIKRHLKTGKIVWNNRGFGINDPGRERDTTKNKENHWDLEYPIDLSRVIDGISPGPQSLKSLLEKIKDELPFNFRFQRGGGGMYDQLVKVPKDSLTADEAFHFVAEHLADKWKITALVGWVIMYKDDDKKYPGAFRYYGPGGVVTDQEPETRSLRRGETSDDVEEEGIPA